MLNKPCPKCKTLIPYGRAYCDACLPVVLEAREKAKEHRDAKRRQKYNKAYNARRDPKYGKFYTSKEWRTLSKAKLSDCGYRCEAGLPGCQRIACEVHHTTPIKTPEGWEKRLEWDGLQGVCIACHNILDGKTFKRVEDSAVLDLRKIER